jgi:hypothetical protein
MKGKTNIEGASRTQVLMAVDSSHVVKGSTMRGSLAQGWNGYRLKKK